MGASGQSQDDEDGGLIADINVTPLVDITLVLLIIFMVAAPLIVNNPSIKVDLPKAATSDDTPKSPLSLTIARAPAGGYTLYLNGVETREDAVRAAIPAMARENAGLQAVISADKEIAYGDLIYVVDLVKALGVHRFALNTEVKR